MVDQQVQELMRQVMDMNRMLGNLAGKVGSLTETWQRQDAEATAGRRRLYEKFEELQGIVTRLTERVNAIMGDAEDMQTSIKTFDEQHNQNIGSKKATAAIWGALFMLAGSAGAIAIKLLEWFWPPRH
ncbi:hypothetical protein [Bradyrhizobium sp. RT9a]|uniref:hypothetical protein n=1 Tax=Bradyrhizobium sp. RT9a TaxID=3156384 RepID=UPI00339B59BB